MAVHGPGANPRPIDPSLDIRSHSPAGLDWGYGGSGPAQLALALAADDRAQSGYQAFKFCTAGCLRIVRR